MPCDKGDPKMVKRKATMKDVAAAVGVSHTTVSLALRGSTKITETRRQEIQAMARRMGYQLNPMGVGLAHYRSTSRQLPVQATIAWLNFWEDPKEMRNFREFNLYWQGAEDAARKLGYRLEPFEYAPDVSPKRLAQILLTRSVRGILIPPHGGPYIKHFRKMFFLDWERFAVVRFGYTVPELKVVVVASNQLANMRIVLKNLRDKGYDRIGYATEELQVSHALDAYMGDWIRLPEKQRVAPLRVPSSADELRLSLFKAWYRREKPDAIVSDLPEVPRWLTACGLKAPDDVALAAMSVLDGGG